MYLVNTNSFEPNFIDPITFVENEMEGVSFSSSDAIIIKANIEGVEVRRLFLYKRSSCDVMFLNVFMIKKWIKSSFMMPYMGGLAGFTGHEAPITWDDCIVGLKTTTKMIDFLVMDVP